MDLEELRVLVAVAETGSLLGAAERLGITRSTLRRRIDDLEARVRLPLLVRGPQGATLTDAGHQLATRGQRLLAEAAALLAAVRDERSAPAGRLRVAIPVGLPPQVLAHLYEAVRAAYPHLHLDARFTDDPLAGLGERADLAFHFGAQLPDGPWITRVLHRSRAWLLASPRYLAQHPAPQTADDLHQHAILTWSAPGLDPNLLPRLHGPALPIQPVLTSNDIHLLRQLALAGQGIAFVPDAQFPDPVPDDEALVPLLVDEVGRTTTLRMIVPEALARSSRVNALLTELTSYFEEG